MAGGLLQMVISGKQDIYLTHDPEITFFKKAYRRHTNFSIEIIEITPEQTPNFNSSISFLLNKGDAIHRCYFEINLPQYDFSDQYITDSSYTNKKIVDISNLNRKLSNYKDQYTKLKGFVDVEIKLYRILYNYLQSENVTISNLKELVATFNYSNKTSKDKYKGFIDEGIFYRINMSGYIMGIDKLITSNTTTSGNYITANEILINLSNQYDIMKSELNNMNNQINIINKNIYNLSKPNRINFNFAPYLGHNFFDSVQLEINGQEFDTYTKDVLHINQMHSISPESMNNYFEMIGHTSELTNHDDTTKGGRKILVPLIFWFNKNSGASLPLVAMQYSPVIINTKIADVSKIINFQNFEQSFINITQLTIKNTLGYIKNNNLLYTNIIYNNNNTIYYDCKLINSELLRIKFSDLSDNEINIILEKNGERLTLNQITQILRPNLNSSQIRTINGSNGVTTQYVLDKIGWIKFLLDIKNPIYSNFASKIMDYHSYINYNLYTNIIKMPEIKLVYEAIFMDDVERAKFANSKLEYVIERYSTDTFTFKNKTYFDCEISITNPCKELIWYIQPNILSDGISEFNTNTSLKFDLSDILQGNLIEKQKLSLNQQEILLENIDSNYYTYLLSYKYLNNILPEGLYYHSFCLYPEESQPSGTANLRAIKGKQYSVIINKECLSDYTNKLTQLYNNKITDIDNKLGLNLKIIGKIYDLFVVSNSKANLLFS